MSIESRLNFIEQRAMLSRAEPADLAYTWTPDQDRPIVPPEASDATRRLVAELAAMDDAVPEFC